MMTITRVIATITGATETMTAMTMPGEIVTEITTETEIVIATATGETRMATAAGATGAAMAMPMIAATATATLAIPTGGIIHREGTETVAMAPRATTRDTRMARQLRPRTREKASPTTRLLADATGARITATVAATTALTSSRTCRDTSRATGQATKGAGVSGGTKNGPRTSVLGTNLVLEV